MIRLPKSLYFHWFLFFLSLFLLGAAFFFEYAKGLTPCPICISQRLVVTIILLLSLCVLVIRPSVRWLRFFGILLCLFSLFGVALAARQLYLESLPSSSHEVCLPGLSYMMQILPWKELMQSMLLGGPECGKIQWQFLDLTMAGWLLITFMGTTIIGLLETMRKHSVYENN